MRMPPAALRAMISLVASGTVGVMPPALVTALTWFGTLANDASMPPAPEVASKCVTRRPTALIPPLLVAIEAVLPGGTATRYSTSQPNRTTGGQSTGQRKCRTLAPRTRGVATPVLPVMTNLLAERCRAESVRSTVGRPVPGLVSTRMRNPLGR
jgi:hypothetical protein